MYFNELNVRFGASGFVLNHIINLPELFINYLLNKDIRAINTPDSFMEMSFSSEKVLRHMYYDGTISFKKYKAYLNEADILSLKDDEDNMPYHLFLKSNRMLPLRKFYQCKKRKLKTLIF